MACPFAFSALAGLICFAWVRRKLPKVIYHTPTRKMNCQRRLENPNSSPIFTIDSGCGDVLRLIQPGAPQGSHMQRDMQWDVTCCPVTSASLLAILCLAYSIAMCSLQGRNTMTSQPIRDQVEAHLLHPQNAALLIIDYQPPQVNSIVSMDPSTLVANIVAVARLAKLYALPIVLSSVNVKTGFG